MQPLPLASSADLKRKRAPPTFRLQDWVYRKYCSGESIEEHRAGERHKPAMPRFLNRFDDLVCTGLILAVVLLSSAPPTSAQGKVINYSH